MNPSPSLTVSDRPSASPGGHSAPETLRCTSTADFLAALPLLTGFTDQNSLYLVLFQGRRGGNVLRMDLPKTQAPHDMALLLDGIVALLRDTGAGVEGPAVVITTSQTFAEHVGPPWGRLANHLKRRMRREGWSLRELAVIAQDGWCGLLGDGPGAPRPLSEITDSNFALSVRARGPLPQALSSIGVLPAATPARTVAVAKYLLELDHRRAQQDPTATNHSIDWLRKTTRLAGSCFGLPQPTAARGQRASQRGKLPAKRLAQLIDTAQDHSRWLVLMLTALTRSEFVVNVALESGLDRYTDIRIADVPDATRGTREAWSIEHLLFSLSHELPEREKLRTVVAVLEDAIVHAPREMRPSLFAFLAWAWWMLGMQSVAARAIEQSLEIQSDHELTLMLQRLSASPPAAHLHRLRSEFDRSGAAA